MALVHYPVYNRHQQVIASAVTNLDLHDIARACKTYGVHRFYVVTPLADQHRLVRRLLDHWLRGRGSQVHPERKAALELVELADSVDDVVQRNCRTAGKQTKLLATAATVCRPVFTYGEARQWLTAGGQLLILFGTAWGLSREVMELADYQLPPIDGRHGYNHLSVRSAASIILDRLLSDREELS
ncbi:MAG: RNA methyltransferase [Deltaproteobacteria bacterium]|nr:RNA methyltransferase [Deltaproteobacteria bacterium]MBW2070939.1 RNA methyltransferase [Deltaproteobacteria bacterium]